jgi:hypothetical protein
MRLRSPRTLKAHGLTAEAFKRMWRAQDGRCAICAISEDDLTKRHPDWASDQILHIDHEKRSVPRRVRGLLCKDCNYDLEAYISGTPMEHPAMRGLSIPRRDPRFREYLDRTGGSGPRPIMTELLERHARSMVTVRLRDGSQATGELIPMLKRGAFMVASSKAGMEFVGRVKDIVEIVSTV